MREIEFRAYIKDIKKIVDVYDIDFSQGTISFMNPYDTKYTCRKFNEVEIMQCTGLTDKNGTNIFEGDIIKTYHGNGKVVYSKQYALFGYIMLEKDNTEKEYDYRFTDVVIEDGIEVIGNIYDNPEILEI